MFKKIAFLSLNPLENFLPSTFHDYIRDYYQWILGEALLREDSLYCQEKIETYGEAGTLYGKGMFGEKKETLQLLYVKSNQKELLEEVFNLADLVFVGMPGSKKEREKIFLSVLPWIGKVVFLFDDRLFDKKTIWQIEQEYKINDAQMMEIKKLPSFLTEALIS